MLACWRFTPGLPSKGSKGFRCRVAEDQQIQYGPVEKQSKSKVLIVGSGWAGLGAAHHLCKQVEYFASLYLRRIMYLEIDFLKFFFFFFF